MLNLDFILFDTAFNKTKATAYLFKEEQKKICQMGCQQANPNVFLIFSMNYTSPGFSTLHSW